MNKLWTWIKSALLLVVVVIFGLFLAIVFHKDGHGGGGH